MKATPFTQASSTGWPEPSEGRLRLNMRRCVFFGAIAATLCGFAPGTMAQQTAVKKTPDGFTYLDSRPVSCLLRRGPFRSERCVRKG
jgi:hypothetical protein